MIYIKAFAFFIAAAISFSGFSQIIVWTDVDSNSTSQQETPFLGSVKKKIRYSDVVGEHFVIFSKLSGISKKDPNPDREESHQIFVNSYKKVINGWALEWFVKDGVDCPNLDSEANFYTEKIQVSDADADGDGVGEIYIPYYYVCTGDVSPYVVKIIVRSGEKKFAVRGESKIMVDGGRIEGGGFKLDKNLENSENRKIKEKILKIWNVISSLKYGE